jgi:hypothetical protein
MMKSAVNMRGPNIYMMRDQKAFFNEGRIFNTNNLVRIPGPNIYYAYLLTLRYTGAMKSWEE